jgi:hypothetical protein
MYENWDFEMGVIVGMTVVVVGYFFGAAMGWVVP